MRVSPASVLQRLQLVKRESRQTSSLHDSFNFLHLFFLPHTGTRLNVFLNLTAFFIDASDQHGGPRQRHLDGN